MKDLISYYNSGHIDLALATDSPYTHINLAFLYPPRDKPLELILDGAISAGGIHLSERSKEAIAQIQDAGKKVLVSFGGGGIHHLTYSQLVGHEMEIAKEIADFVLEHNLNGVDIDFEDSVSFEKGSRYSGSDFLIHLSQNLRSLLPQEKYLLTHAPQPPYLVRGGYLSGYVRVMEAVGEQIDWLNIQFYNNMPWSANPSEIIKACQAFAKLPGMLPHKVVLGFPVTRHDAASGFLPVDEIISKIIDPLSLNMDFGGVMNWQFSSDVQGLWAQEIQGAMTQKVLDRKP